MQRATGVERKEIDDRVVFLQEFLRHPLQVGSVIPSSPFLERRVVRMAGVRSARTIVELGAGTGGTTRAILEAMPRDARLLTIEINEHFCNLLRRIDDPRLIVHRGSADDLRESIAAHGLRAPDAMVSGIPFSTMSRAAGAAILEAIASSLAPGGRFLAYQVSRQVDVLARPFLGKPRVEFELLNIPPMRLFAWRKPEV